MNIVALQPEQVKEIGRRDVFGKSAGIVGISEDVNVFVAGLDNGNGYVGPSATAENARKHGSLFTATMRRERFERNGEPVPEEVGRLQLDEDNPVANKNFSEYEFIKED